jgi:selenocysteine lyase/cysteine desulfurase
VTSDATRARTGRASTSSSASNTTTPVAGPTATKTTATKTTATKTTAKPTRPRATQPRAPRRVAPPTREPHASLVAYRAEFPILSRKTYLNSCSLGALSHRSMRALTRYQELWNEHGAQAWYTIWMGELAAMREKFARLIGAQPHEVALAPNVSVALGGIASGLDFGKRQRVIAADIDFPTLAYQWLARQRLGVTAEFVASRDHMTIPAEDFLPHIDDRTALVATSRVFYLSGYIQDIQTLAEAAHRHGAYLLVDDYQGTGQIPIDVKALGIDFLVTGTLKWLMGGPGLALVYVREELIPTLRPTITGWFGARDQFQFRTTDFEYREDAARLEAGTPAVGPVYTASAALDIVHEVGVPAIRERTRYLADDLIRRAQAMDWPVRGPLDSAQRSSIVMLGLERPAEIVAALTARNIIVDFRPGLLRISPHFYNTIEENELIVAAIAEILRERGR